MKIRMKREVPKNNGTSTTKGEVLVVESTTTGLNLVYNCKDASGNEFSVYRRECEVITEETQ